MHNIRYNVECGLTEYQHRATALWYGQRKLDVRRQKSVSVPLCPSQIPRAKANGSNPDLL